MNHSLSVREIQREDVPFLVKYWTSSSPEYLIGMGAEPSKLPSKEQFTNMLMQQIDTPITEKGSYALIWLMDDQAIGHTNVNQIEFGKQAYMHLHLWKSSLRQKGVGTKLVQLSIPMFFKNLQLKTLFCEPYALNPAPNKTLEKIGFTFIKKYTTTPGFINFEQEVNCWKLDADEL